MPESWTEEYSNLKGTGYHSWNVKVDYLAINKPFPDSIFNLQIPVGTVVKDTITKTDYIKRESDERPIQKGEWRITREADNYKEILKTDPPGAWDRWIIIAIAVLLCLIIVVGFVYWRKKRHGKSTPH